MRPLILLIAMYVWGVLTGAIVALANCSRVGVC